MILSLGDTNAVNFEGYEGIDTIYGGGGDDRIYANHQ